MKGLKRNLISASMFGMINRFADAERVLITFDHGSVQWTCFDDDAVERCCESIQAASQEVSLLPPSLSKCTSQLAKVPVFVGGSLQSLSDNTARYSLTIELNSSSGQGKKQFLWERNTDGSNTVDTKVQMLDSQTFPYLIGVELSPSISIHSELSALGGMHRRLRHNLGMTDDFSTCYIFVTVPDGMFVDLDDAFEASNGVNITVHSAGVCDIEQPAFVSGQHSIVFEARDFDRDFSFASKLQLRYPLPSSTNEQFVPMPIPQVLCANPRGDLVGGTTSQTEMELIWVAAGNDDDYNLVMLTTVFACLVGVIWMMSDISQVARWDE